MPQQFLGVDPATGKIHWSLAVDQGDVPSLADMQAANLGVTVLRVPWTPELHDPRFQHLYTVDVGRRQVAREGGQPLPLPRTNERGGRIVPEDT